MRTNIDIDTDVLAEAQRITGARTKRETVDLALRELVGRRRQRDMLELRPHRVGGRSRGEPPRPHRMIAVDTSIWVDFLRGTDSPGAQRLERLLDAGAPLALTDVVFAELLQGVRSDADAELLERRLRAFPILRLEASRTSRWRPRCTDRRAPPVTIRKTLDCLIAAPCVRDSVPLLHADPDFDRLAGCTALRVVA